MGHRPALALSSRHLAALPPALLNFYVFALGAIVGSFLNVVIHRLPDENLSIVKPRSRCPHCGYSIPAWLNVPILSWVVLGGRCKSCKASISIRYPVVELLTGTLFLAMLIRHGPTLAAALGMLLAAGLIAITFIDIDIWEIPDEISLPGIFIGAALRPVAFEVPWYDGILGAAIGWTLLWGIRAFYFLIRKVEGMGFGDVKLIGMIGAFVGPYLLLPTILLASVSGTVVGVIVWVVSRGEEAEAPVTEAEEDDDSPPESTDDDDAREDGDPAMPERAAAAGSAEAGEEDDEEDWEPPENAVPFGPFLSLGGLAAYLFGHDIFTLILRLLPG